MSPSRFPVLLLLAAWLLPSCAGTRRAGPALAQTGLPARGEHAGAWALLETAAADLDPAIRGRALALLIRHSPEPAGGAWAPRALWDPNAWVQRQAIEVLAQRAIEPEARRLLSDLVGRPNLDPYVRCTAATRLAEGGDRGTLPAVRAVLEEETEGWRAAPCALAAARMGDPAATEQLAGILREGELAFDISFIEDLGTSGIEPLVPALADAADLVEEPLRPAIGAALLRLGSPRGEALLREGLADPHPQAQLEALDYLADIPGEAATGVIRRAAGSASGVTRTYARLILLARGQDGIQIAEEAALDDDREVRAFAMRFLGEAVEAARQGEGSRRLERAALRLLRLGASDLDDPVQEAAARAMGSLRDASVGADLEKLLQDDSARVQVEAAGALLSISAAHQK